jgi:hypothetical protein
MPSNPSAFAGPAFGKLTLAPSQNRLSISRQALESFRHKHATRLPSLRAQESNSSSSEGIFRANYAPPSSGTRIAEAKGSTAGFAANKGDSKMFRRFHLAWRLYIHLNYSWHLAWHKALRSK